MRQRVCLFAALLVWAGVAVSAAAWTQEPPDPTPKAPKDRPLIDEPDPDEAPAVPSGSTSGSPSSSPMPTAAIAGMMSVFFVVYFIFIGLMVLIGVGGVVLSALAIYDCARRDFPDPSTRAMWCLLIALTRLLGAIIYYFVIYRKGDPPIQPAYVPGTPPPSPLSG
ncbi:MAG: PLDc_N domain-containing protein [Armatimonadetes bacterium]|nr:PLDc_N domain-containing protein [Armatimonadota bacterium]